MKKYITLAALIAAGTAFANAASLGYNSMTDAQKDGVVLAWDFSGETLSAPVVGSNLINGGEFASVSDGVAKVTGSGPWTNKLTTSFTSGNFTFSFDVNSFTANNWQALVSFYSVGGSKDAKSLQIGVDTDGNLSVFNKVAGETGFAGIETNGNIDTGIDSGFSGASTVTLVSDMTDTKTLTVYVNGVSIGSHSGWTATTDQALMGLQIGSAFGDGHRAFPNATISNITLWNKALSADEVASLIPEPSAFGLLAGLGALALVASRRRRK